MKFIVQVHVRDRPILYNEFMSVAWYLCVDIVAADKETVLGNDGYDLSCHSHGYFKADVNF